MSNLDESQRRRVITLRTSDTEERYAAQRQAKKVKPEGNCLLCRLPEAKEFPHLQFWRIVENEFPYDKIAERSFIFMPKRCVNLWSKLTPQEIDEWDSFRLEMGKYNINFSMWSSPTTQSIPAHYHEHLIRLYTLPE